MKWTEGLCCAGASGKLDRIRDQEYGAQDFYGAIDELRVWRTVRTQDQIKQAWHRPLQYPQTLQTCCVSAPEEDLYLQLQQNRNSAGLLLCHLGITRQFAASNTPRLLGNIPQNFKFRICWRYFESLAIFRMVVISNVHAISLLQR